jgi:hypothetical protein
MLNASGVDVEFYTPAFAAKWELLIDTYAPESQENLKGAAQTTIRARSMKLFVCNCEVHPLPKPSF